MTLLKRYVVIPADDYSAMEFDADGFSISGGVVTLYDNEVGGFASFSVNNLIAIYEKNKRIAEQ